MITFSMVSFTISPNSSKPFFNPVAPVTIMPTPTMKDSSNAVRMSHTGGIFSSMKGAKVFPSAADVAISPTSR